MLLQRMRSVAPVIVLSILIRHEGGCYVKTESATLPASRFQSSSATKADATITIPPLDVPPVLSILIRHEGGCYAAIKSIQSYDECFQSSSATKADATCRCSHGPIR